MKGKILALAAAIGSVSTGVSAVELGEFNGTKFSVGGYVKVEGVFNNPDSDAAFGVENTFDPTVRQSRINFKAEKMVEGHKVKGFLEGDFYGDGHHSSTAAWRVRHAYVSIDNLTVGQTWNGQFFAIAPLDGEMINFRGLSAGTIAGNGGVIRRDMQLHYTTNGFRFTAQDPIYVDADLPDMVASYTKRFKSGSAYNVALTAREVQTGTAVDPTASNSKWGFALSVAGKYVLPGGHDIRVSAYSGDGIGAYSGVGIGGAYNPAKIAGVDTMDASGGELVSQYGFAAAYKHQFTDKLRGTIRYGETNVDDAADTKLEMTNINLIYKYWPNMDIGVEWRDQNIDTLNSPPGTGFANVRPKGQQLELMAMYKF